MKRWVAQHDTAAFLVLTFVISWPLWVLSGALTRTPVRAPDHAWLVAQVGVFAPAFAGLIVGCFLEPGAAWRALTTVGVVYVPATLAGLGIAARGYDSFVEIDGVALWVLVMLAAWSLFWFSAARRRFAPWPGPAATRAATALWSIGCVVVPAVLFLAAWAMAGSAHGTSAIPAMAVRELTPGALVAAFATNLVFGGSLGEEPGWRGWWLPRLLERRAPIEASLIIGFWWALWHAPIDLVQGFSLSGIGALVVRQVWTFPVAILFTWATLRAGGSLLPAFALHTTLNAVPDFALAHPARYERATALFWLMMLVAVLGVALRGRWGTVGAVPREP